jgi:hypothetical protein
MTSPRHWNTGDRPTDANLAYMESLATPWRGMTVEHFMDKLRGVIGLQRMLPKAVRDHFTLPFLYIGNSAYDWSSERLQEEATTLCSALEAGLQAVHDDEALRKGGSANLDDRPATRGEEVRAALDAYREYPGSSELSRLRQAASASSLHRYVDRLDKWLARKRPSSPDRSIGYEIASVLGDISSRVDDLHHEPSSYEFHEQRRAALAGAPGSNA